MVSTLLLLGYRMYSGVGPSGLVSAFAALFFFLAVQLAILGVLGEYIGRIYIEAKSRPYYLIQSISENDAQDRASR
jgi:hypothetical protein